MDFQRRHSRMHIVVSVARRRRTTPTDGISSEKSPLLLAGCVTANEERRGRREGWFGSRRERLAETPPGAPSGQPSKPGSGGSDVSHQMNDGS